MIIPKGSGEARPKLGDQSRYGLAGEVLRLIEPHSEADPAALLIQLLVAFGSVIGHGAHFRVEATNHYLNMFAALVGTSAKARKGTSWRHVLSLFQAVDPNWKQSCVGTGLSTGEGLIHAVRDPIEKQDGEIIDDGVSDKRLLMAEEEFGRTLRVMGRDENTLSAVMRQAWDGGDLRVLTKVRSASATGAHVSVIGHITQYELASTLKLTEVGNGFGNRFLWCSLERSKYLPEGGSFSKSDLVPLTKKLRDAVDFAKKVSEMRRDEQAKELWAEEYRSLSGAKPGVVGEITSRAEAQTMRLACLYALLDCSSTVRKEHLQAALSAWQFCFDSAKFIFGLAPRNPTAKKILEALKKAPQGMTRTQINKSLGGHKPPSEIDNALKELQLGGFATSQSNQTAGRTAEKWFPVVDPSV